MDSYQAIYDAVRSKISNGDIGHAADQAMREGFDFSRVREHMLQEVYVVSHEYQRPSAVFRPTLTIDGNQWCALYGDDLQNGVAGFGDSPALALAAFDAAWIAKLPEKSP